MKKRASAAAALAVTGFFLWLAARNVRFDELRAVLAGARWRWLPPMVATALLDLVIRALRWRILLSRAVEAPVGMLIQLEAIGLAVNNVLFARLGEVARGVLAARELKIPVATALSSVVVERALDVWALLAVFSGAAALSGDLVALPVRQAAGLLLTGVAAALLCLAFAERALEPGGAVERRLRRWPKVHDLVAQLVLGAAVLRRPRAALPALGLSLTLWLLDALVYWFGARALGLGDIVDLPRSMLILGWAGAGAALPAAPGAIGTFEAMVKSILERLGADSPAAFGFAVFTHMTMYCVVTSVGLACLYRVGLSLAGLKESLSRKER